MRLKQMLFLTALCGMVCVYGWLVQQTKLLEQQCYDMEQEARLLEQENAALACPGGTIVDGETWEYVRHDEGIKGVT